MQCYVQDGRACDRATGGGTKNTHKKTGEAPRRCRRSDAAAHCGSIHASPSPPIPPPRQAADIPPYAAPSPQTPTTGATPPAPPQSPHHPHSPPGPTLEGAIPTDVWRGQDPLPAPCFPSSPGRRRPRRRRGRHIHPYLHLSNPPRRNQRRDRRGTPPSFRLARQGYRLRTSGVAPPLYAARWRRALARALDSSGACGGSLTPLATDHPTDAGAVQQLQGEGRHFCPSRGNEGACRSTGVAVAGRHLAFWRLHGGELTDGNPQGGRVTPCGRPDSPPAWRPTAACSPSLWQRAVPFQAGHNARNAVRMVAITPIPARAASPAAPSLANGPQRDGGRARWGLPRPGGRKKRRSAPSQPPAPTC